MKLFKNFWTEIVVGFCCVICLIALAFYLNSFWSLNLSEMISDWGAFGDYIGGVLGTILSFFSVILIYATYKNQVEISILQQFETTFFNLLFNQRDILKSLSGEFFNNNPLTLDSEQKEAYDYISAVADKINSKFDGQSKNTMDKDAEGNAIPNIRETKEENEVIVDEIYSKIFKGKENELGHYFRHLYHMVKYVDESKIIDKRKYIDILQAQMSDGELYVTFYNCIAKYGRNKFRKLLDSYSFFENIRTKGEIFQLHCEQFYPDTKFKYLESPQKKPMINMGFLFLLLQCF